MGIYGAAIRAGDPARAHADLHAGPVHDPDVRATVVGDYDTGSGSSATRTARSPTRTR